MMAPRHFSHRSSRLERQQITVEIDGTGYGVADFVTRLESFRRTRSRCLDYLGGDEEDDGENDG